MSYFIIFIIIKTYWSAVSVAFGFKASARRATALSSIFLWLRLNIPRDANTGGKSRHEPSI